MADEKQHEAPGDMSELDVYKAYLRNVRLTEEIQSDIIRGAKAGEDPFSLLLKAVKAISLMTNSDVLYRDVELSMRAVYGASLGESAPIRIELENTERRLEKIRAAAAVTGEGDVLERMKQAIKAHEQAIARFKEQLGEK